MTAFFFVVVCLVPAVFLITRRRKEIKKVKEGFVEESNVSHRCLPNSKEKNDAWMGLDTQSTHTHTHTEQNSPSVRYIGKKTKEKRVVAFLYCPF